MKVGLRIDVDTFRGTRDGVPRLCDLLAAHNIQGTFFFSVGPDNMGRNLWRLFRPTFLKKMLRTKAASLYGWDILLKGTFGPGPMIGSRLASVIRTASDAGHEIGLHAWDHYTWQTRIDKQGQRTIHAGIRRGVEQIHAITGQNPTCSAAPSWKCTDNVLRAKSQFDFTYNSDCRGTSIFQPVVDGKTLPQPQIPTTLPTYDEVIGEPGVTPNNYNDYILSRIKPDKLNILTIHAEVEGLLAHDLFKAFINQSGERHCELLPLRTILNESDTIKPGRVVPQTIPGRDGWVAIQDNSLI